MQNLNFFGCTCGFWIGDAADRHKRQEEEESERQSSLWTLHVGCGGKPARDNLSNTREMKSRWILMDERVTLPPPPSRFTWS